MAIKSIASRPQVARLAINGGTPVSSDPISVVAVKLAEADIDAAVEVLRSGMLAMGKKCLAFEQRFAEETDARHALTCANGTCALQIPYEVLVQPGDEVLCPAWSYVATASMLAARGAKIVWVDADPETFQIDVEDAKRKVTDKTVAIAATHLYGCPVDIDAVEKLAAEKGLSVVYDAAQAHYATYKGQGLGRFGDVVTYSFYPTKNMTTGEGGMVTTNDDDLAATMKLVRSHGEGEKYIHVRVGYNYRMSDVSAAIGLSQMDRIADATAARRRNAAMLDRRLAEIDGLAPGRITEGAASAYHQYPIRIDASRFVTPDDTTRPDALRAEFQELLKAEGVMTAIHYPRSLTHQPMFEPMVSEHPPVAERLASELMCVPIHQHLSERQVDRVGDALAKVSEALRA
ncbi:MAG: DegT/DnrJ/EryC1/StrS family aminotransferase [Phycisphaerales bacterium]